MKRFARYSHTTLTALSLLLCAATVLFSTRTYRQSDWLTYLNLSRHGKLCQFRKLVLWTGGGNIAIELTANAWEDGADDWHDHLHGPPQGWSWDADKVEDPAASGAEQTFWNRRGFAFEIDLTRGSYP